MTTKRRRLEEPIPTEEIEKSPLIDSLSSENDRTVLKALLNLKKVSQRVLSNENGFFRFLTPPKTLPTF